MKPWNSKTSLQKTTSYFDGRDSLFNGEIFEIFTNYASEKIISGIYKKLKREFKFHESNLMKNEP